MHNIGGYSNLNSLTFNVCKSVMIDGFATSSRNGDTIEICDTGVVLTDIKNRHLYLDGRKNNLFAMMAEVFWIMSGSDKLDPLINFFLPRAINYSDDGKTWRAGYGPRIYDHSQIDNVVQMFLQDSINTRRAVMTIYQPNKDSLRSLKASGLDSTKDLPCSNLLSFWIRDNKLNCKLNMRSNDVIFGMSAINVPEFTFLQEVILRLLQNADPETYNNVTLGYYHHSVISLHLYNDTIQQAKDIISNSLINEHRMEDAENKDILLGGVINSENIKMFFQEICESFGYNIRSEEFYHRVKKIFDQWKVPTENNQLFDYASLVEYYIDSEKTGNVEDITSLYNSLSLDLKLAVRYNNFTKKRFKIS